MVKIEVLISYLLRIGVIVSMSLVAAGVLLSFHHHPTWISQTAALSPLLRGDNPYPTTLQAVMHGLAHGDGSALVILGLIILIATPVMRVAVAVLAFLLQRDGIFVAITATVLALLLISFVLGRAGG